MIDFIADILSKMLLGIEFLSALITLIYFPKVKNTFWKWFCIYLIFIFSQEFYWYFNDSLKTISKQEYYAFLGFPIQYIFLYWLYALKSLKNKKLFLICFGIYISTYFPVELYYEKTNIVYSLNLTIGTILLTYLVILEFIKQIKTDNILNFKENKMFYINLGVILYYIGTYPFFAFYDILLKEPFITIGNFYFIYFKASVCVLYLFYILSFIWGKHLLK